MSAITPIVPRPRAAFTLCWDDRRMAPHSLIAPAGRRWAVGIVVVATIVLAVLGVLVHDKQGSSLDTHVTTWVFWHFRSRSVARALLQLSDPAFDVGVLATVAIGAGWRRAWRICVLAVAGPVIAILISEKLLKPGVHRVIGHGLAFPSGHETGIASVATVVAVLLLRTGARRAVKVAGIVALAAWSVFAAVGLVRAFVHYPTDTVGGVCVALATVLVTALLVDAVADRRVRKNVRTRPGPPLSEPVVPDPPRTARAT
jgi:membrane-associated phospholipid phosphatase